MTALRKLRGDYAGASAGGDPVRREVARRQLARLATEGAGRPTGRAPSRWAHVPLADLFGQAGNTAGRRGDGTAECGHEPFHGSRSGRCVTIDEARGLWYCRSCRRGGDAARLVTDLHGCSYRRAAEWLEARYGAPAGTTVRRRPVPEWVEA